MPVWATKAPSSTFHAWSGKPCIPYPLSLSVEPPSNNTIHSPFCAIHPVGKKKNETIEHIIIPFIKNISMIIWIFFTIWGSRFIRINKVIDGVRRQLPAIYFASHETYNILAGCLLLLAHCFFRILFSTPFISKPQCLLDHSVCVRLESPCSSICKAMLIYDLLTAVAV